MANQLTQHIASRARSTDFVFMGMLLPNPDPILKAQGRDIRVYRDMRSDALIGGSIRRRKSAVKALDNGVDRGRSASRVTKAVQEMLQGLDLDGLIGDTLNACFYGYQPLEVMWERRGAMLVPASVVAKPPEWFGFDADNLLRFKSREALLHGEELPPRKFLLPRQEPTYTNPYGLPDLSMCFWPLVFKKGGMKFWLAFVEKYGSAFALGKLPRGASDKDRTLLLDSLEALIQDGVATIPDDGSVELLEMAGKSASSDLHQALVMHCRGEISIALLGQNQTTEASANKASATAGLEVTEDLRDADAKLVAATVNELIKWFCELNFASVLPPVFSLWDQEAQDRLQAERDKSNYAAGARFTNAYFMRAYGYQEGDLQYQAPGGTTPLASAAGGRVVPAAEPEQDAAAFAEAALQVAGADPMAAEVDELAAAAAPSWTGMVRQLEALVARAESMEQLQAALLSAYGGAPELTRVMGAAMALAELRGMAAVQAESGDDGAAGA